MKSKPQFHESFQREEAIALPDEKHFARVISGVLAALSLFVWWHHGAFGVKAIILAALAGALFTAGMLCPAKLRPLNRAWMKLGLLLHTITNPIIMLLIYGVAILPLGLCLRAIGKDLLRQKIDKNAPTYWIPRQPPGPAPESIRQQF